MNTLETSPKTLLQALKNNYSPETFSKHREVLENIQITIDDLLNNFQNSSSKIENSADKITVLKIVEILKKLSSITGDYDDYISQIEYYLDDDDYFEVALEMLNSVISLIEIDQNDRLKEVIKLVRLEKLKLSSSLRLKQSNLNMSRTTNFRHYLCSNKIYFQDCF